MMANFTTVYTGSKVRIDTTTTTQTLPLASGQGGGGKPISLAFLLVKAVVFQSGRRRCLSICLTQTMGVDLDTVRFDIGIIYRELPPGKVKMVSL